MGWADNIGAYNPFEYRYKNYDIDRDVLAIYRDTTNSKFDIERKEPDLSCLPDTFDLFAAQQPTSVDRNHTQDALKYAKNKKRHVVVLIIHHQTTVIIGMYLKSLVLLASIRTLLQMLIPMLWLNVALGFSVLVVV